MILGLINYYENISRDEFILDAIEYFSNGVLLCQKGNENEFPYGAYLSWRNLWHAYGNIQAYAMLKAGQLLGEDKYIQSALMEIDNFYPYLTEKSFPASFYVQLDEEGSMYPADIRYSQIAYNFRPLIWACTEAYILTGDSKYKPYP